MPSETGRPDEGHLEKEAPEGSFSGSPAAAILAAVVIPELLCAATLLDLRRRSQPGLRGSQKPWVAAALVNFVVRLAYFAIGRRGASVRS